MTVVTVTIASETRPAVVVTAVAATTSLADDIDATWSGLLAGRSGIGRLDDDFVAEYDLPVRIGGKLKSQPGDQLTRIEQRRHSYVEQMALVLGRQVWRNAGAPEVEGERLAVVIGTGLGGGDALINAVDSMRDGGYRKVSPMSVPMVMPNGPAATVGLEIGAKAGVFAPVSACSSGSEAIAHAWRLITTGEADIVVAGGVEGHIDAVPIASFAMMRAMSTRNDEPERASRPFDRDRDGFVFGEAGALLVLESERHARARGAHIHGRVLGAGITSDAYHIVASEPEGIGAARHAQGDMHCRTAGFGYSAYQCARHVHLDRRCLRSQCHHRGHPGGIGLRTQIRTGSFDRRGRRTRIHPHHADAARPNRPAHIESR